MNKRILFSNNGTLQDWTMALNNFNGSSKVIDYIVGQDSLYIGSKLPFNSIYFNLETPSAAVSEMSVQYYSNGWNDVVELIDETQGFTQSGHINIVPNKNGTWTMKPDSSEVEGLSNVIIYDHYWLKISFNVNLTNTTSLKWIGVILSSDDDLSTEFPDLLKSSVMASYKAGKCDWLEQHAKAAEMIEHDLINKGIIDGSENILDRSWYKNASVQKVAEIIFSAFGDDYVDQRSKAREEYQLRLNKRLARVDKSNDAIEEVSDTRNVSGFLSR